MAWTDITYSCGHEDRVQMYGPEIKRQARVFAYRQRPCEACRKASFRPSEEYIRPGFELGNAGPGKAKITVHRTYDCWRELAARGYRLESLDGILADEDPIEPGRQFAEPDARKAYVRIFEDREAFAADIEWLTSNLQAERLDHRPPERHPLPAAFERFEDEWGPAFSAKVADACAIIHDAIRKARKPYVAFSGGKDSTATLILVDAVAPSTPVIWADHELEFPESVAYMERTAARLGPRFTALLGYDVHPLWHIPWAIPPYWRDPLPGSVPISLPMPEWAAAEGYRLTFLGLRGDESKVRGTMLSEVGPTYRRRTGLVCCPLWNWDDESVWKLIRTTGADYNAAYDRYREIGLPPERQRIASLPRSPRDTLARGWPELLDRLEARYGPHWS